MSKDYSNLIHFMEDEVPFNKLLKMKVEECGEGFARIRIPFRDELVGDTRRPASWGSYICWDRRLWRPCGLDPVRGGRSHFNS
jgi:hypothetical protein